MKVYDERCGGLQLGRTIGEALSWRHGFQQIWGVFGTRHELPVEGQTAMPAFGMSWRFSSSLLGTTTLVTKLAFHPMPRMQLIPLFAYSTIAALYAGAFRCLSGQCGSWEAQCLSAVCVQWV